MIVTLEQAKHQCRIEHDEEDDMLILYILAAQEHGQNYIDRKIYTDSNFDDEKGIEVTPIIQQAILLAVGFFYENRVITANLPKAFYELLQPYRIYGT